MKIAIVGGGIAGLSAALSLSAAGFQPTVYEAAVELKPLGVGINLLPHAVRELAELGLLDGLRGLGVEIDGLDYHMSDGRKVWSETRGTAAGYHWPQIAIHRGRLQLFLRDKVRDALGSEALRTGHAFSSLEQRMDGVTLHFHGGASAQADTVVGADGIHSAVRKQFYPDEGRPVWNGVSLFRSTTRMPSDAFGPRMIWAGHSDQKFIAYPIMRDGDGVILNWVCDLRTADPGSEPFEDWNRLGDRDMLLHRYRDWRWEGVDIPAILSAASDVFEFPMVDRDPLPRWSFGRVTLIGDAAHPMYPIGSNGATQAIIDGRVLAYHLASGSDPGDAFSRFESARLGPTSAIVLSNRAGGPDKVLELARQRASDPSCDLDTVFPFDERAAISSSYRKLAGFDPSALNTRASWSIKAG